ncbi:MAG: hypothetical protein WD845_06840 [Pirellulales bacterium]
MDAPVTVRPVDWPVIDAPVARQIVRAALATLFTFVTLAALALFMRRIDGSLRAPLPTATLLALAVGLALGALACRYSAARAPGCNTSLARFTVWAAPTAVLVLWTVGVLLPGTTPSGWATFLGLLLVEEGWSWGRFPKKGSGVVNNDSRPLFSESAASVDVDETATQLLVRRREPDGGDAMEGWVRVGFEPGQRHALAHLAICPPMTTTPACYAEASDGPPAQVKVGQVLPYGVRLEIKLDETASEACEVLVEFSIQERR